MFLGGEHLLLFCAPLGAQPATSKPISDSEPLVTSNPTDGAGAGTLHRHSATAIARSTSQSLNASTTAVDLSDTLKAAEPKPTSVVHHTFESLAFQARAFLLRHVRASLWFVPTAVLYGINNNLGAHLQVQMDAATYQVRSRSYLLLPQVISNSIKVATNISVYIYEYL